MTQHLSAGCVALCRGHARLEGFSRARRDWREDTHMRRVRVLYLAAMASSLFQILCIRWRPAVAARALEAQLGEEPPGHEKAGAAGESVTWPAVRSQSTARGHAPVLPRLVPFLQQLLGLLGGPHPLVGALRRVPSHSCLQVQVQGVASGHDVVVVHHLDESLGVG